MEQLNVITNGGFEREDNLLKTNAYHVSTNHNNNIQTNQNESQKRNTENVLMKWSSLTSQLWWASLFVHAQNEAWEKVCRAHSIQATASQLIWLTKKMAGSIGRKISDAFISFVIMYHFHCFVKSFSIHSLFDYHHRHTKRMQWVHCYHKTQENGKQLTLKHLTFWHVSHYLAYNYSLPS